MASNRRVERLISAARRKSHNIRYDTNRGISDREVLELINDGSKDIFTKIVGVNSDLYKKEAFISITAGTAAYTLPSRIFLGGRVIDIQFSQSGLWTTDAYTFSLKGTIGEYDREYFQGYPENYLFLNGQLILSPIPSITVSNGLRVVYREEPSTLDIRRGVVHSNTSYNSGTGVLSTFTMNTASTPFDSNSEILNEDWVCIVDKSGTFLMRNIGQVTAFDTTTGVITFSSDFRGTSTETAPSGSYITSGWNATTHSPFDPYIDDYLVDYAALYLLAHDVDDRTYQWYDKKLKDKEKQILLTHSSLSLTENFIPIPLG